MKRGDKTFYNIIIRYLLLVLIALPGMDIFYYLFLQITKYPVYFGLQLFYNPVLIGHSIFIGVRTIEIIGACVAGSAYYFLMILNFSTPGLNWKKRISILLSTWGAFYLINVVRIYVLSLMYLNGSVFFDITHKIFWYLGSTIFLVLIWFVSVKIFNIKRIPIFDDLKVLYGHSNLKKKDNSRIRKIKNAAHS